MPRPLLVLSWWLFFAADVRAQPLFFTVETLDWMAADSQVVVRAVVVDFVDEVGQAEWSAHDSLPPGTPPRKVKGKPFDRIHSGLTLGELVALLGRGWMPGPGGYEEGCGIIRWTCEDGRELSVWPMTSRPKEIIEAGPRQLGGGGGRGRMWMTRPREGRAPEDIPIPPK